MSTLFREDRPEVEVIGRDPDSDLSMIHRLYECRRCYALVKNQAGHIAWHSGVDSVTTEVRS